MSPGRDGVLETPLQRFQECRVDSHGNAVLNHETPFGAEGLRRGSHRGGAFRKGRHPSLIIHGGHGRSSVDGEVSDASTALPDQGSPA